MRNGEWGRPGGGSLTRKYSVIATMRSSFVFIIEIVATRGSVASAHAGTAGLIRSES